MTIDEDGEMSICDVCLDRFTHKCERGITSFQQSKIASSPKCREMQRKTLILCIYQFVHEGRVLVHLKECQYQ